MTNRHHHTGAFLRRLPWLLGALAFALPVSAATVGRTPNEPADTYPVVSLDTTREMNAAQKEYLDMRKDETIQVVDAGEGNLILLTAAARAYSRDKVVGIFWVPRDIRRYGRVNKEIRERRDNPHAHLSGIPVRKLTLHTPSQEEAFFSIDTSDNLVLANGEAYDSHNATHQGQPLYTVWEEHRISTEAGRWLRLLIGNQLSTLAYQGPSIPMETTRRADLKKPRKMSGATEEEWRNAVAPEER